MEKIGQNPISNSYPLTKTCSTAHQYSGVKLCNKGDYLKQNYNGLEST